MAETPRRAQTRRTEALTRAPKSQSLIPAKPLRTMEGWNKFAAAAKASGEVNLISPVVAIDHIPPMSQLALQVVELDATVNDRGTGVDCYFDRRFCEHDRGKPLEVAFGKRALLKIMQAAGLEKIGSYRSDDRSDPNYCEWTVVLAGEGLDGKPRRTTRSKEIDFRDGRPDTRKPEWVEEGTGANKRNRKTGRTVVLADDVLGEKRKNIQALAETKALTSAIRELLVLPHKLPVEIMAQRFLIPSLVPCLDESDPDVKAALIQKRIHGSSLLYGGQIDPGLRRPPLPPPPVEPLIRIEEPEGDAEGLALEAGGQVTVEETADGQVLVDEDPLGVEIEDGPPPPGDHAEPPPVNTRGQKEPPPSSRNPRACDCPCGCSEVLAAVPAKHSKARLKCLRCSRCYPDQGFDLEAHQPVGDLKLPGYPGADAAQVERWNTSRRSS